MIPGLPNPWVILGVVVAFLAFGGACYVKGGDHKDAEWTVAVAKQKQEANTLLLKTKDENAAVVAKLNARNAELESKNADQHRYIKDIQIANGRFIAATCGMFDKNGRRRDGGENGVSADTATAGVPAEIPLACLLPERILDAIGDLLARADGSEADAVTGHEYAVGLNPIVNATQAPSLRP